MSKSLFMLTVLVLCLMTAQSFVTFNRFAVQKATAGNFKNKELQVNIFRCFIFQFCLNYFLHVNLVDSSTSLYAHHVQKKVIKKKMHTRPKKSRPSDINRSNTNANKCITKVPNAPADYTLMSAEGIYLFNVFSFLFFIWNLMLSFLHWTCCCNGCRLHGSACRGSQILGKRRFFCWMVRDSPRGHGNQLLAKCWSTSRGWCAEETPIGQVWHPLSSSTPMQTEPILS